MADGIRQAKRPQPGGFDLSTFAPSLDAEAGESLGAFLEEFKSTERPLKTMPNTGTYFPPKIMVDGRWRYIVGIAEWHDHEHDAREAHRLRVLLAQAESSLNAIENLCALNPRLADGEVHHTAMWALAAVREGRR